MLGPSLARCRVGTITASVTSSGTKRRAYLEENVGALHVALSDDEIDDVIAFLQTLTDGWTPPR